MSQQGGSDAARQLQRPPAPTPPTTPITYDNHSFNSVTDFIAFLRGLPNAPERLRHLERFQHFVVGLRNAIFDGIESVWTFVENDRDIQTIHAINPARFDETFSTLANIATNVRRDRDRKSEAHRRLGTWASAAFLYTVIPSLTNNSVGVLDALQVARRRGVTPLRALQNADRERRHRLARVAEYATGYATRTELITSGDITRGNAVNAVHDARPDPARDALIQQAMRGVDMFHGPGGVYWRHGGVPARVQDALANEGQPLPLPAARGPIDPRVQTVQTERALPAGAVAPATPSTPTAGRIQVVIPRRDAAGPPVTPPPPPRYPLRSQEGGRPSYAGMQGPGTSSAAPPRPPPASPLAASPVGSPGASTQGSRLSSPGAPAPSPSSPGARSLSHPPSLARSPTVVERGGSPSSPVPPTPGTGHVPQAGPSGSPRVGQGPTHSRSPSASSQAGGPPSTPLDPKRARRYTSPPQPQSPKHPAEIMKYIDELTVRTERLQVGTSPKDAKLIPLKLPDSATRAQRLLFRLFRSHAQGLAENRPFKISDEDRERLATREVTANLRRDVQLIVDALSRMEPPSASLAAYLQGAHTYSRLALSNELHRGNPTGVREAMRDILTAYHGAPIRVGQAGQGDWTGQGVTLVQHDLESILLDELHSGWLNDQLIQALLLMMTHTQFELAARRTVPGPPAVGHFVVDPNLLSAWRSWQGPTARHPQRPVVLLPQHQARLVIPIHWGNHWAVATYDPERHALQYWDSHYDARARENNTREAYRFLEELLHQNRQHLVAPGFRHRGPTRGTLTSQIQTNTADCGVFAVENARRFIEDTGNVNVAPITTALRSHLLAELFAYLGRFQEIPTQADARQMAAQRRQELQDRGGQSAQRPLSLSSSPSPSVQPRIDTHLGGMRTLSLDQGSPRSPRSPRSPGSPYPPPSVGSPRGQGPGQGGREASPRP
ncbi:hypothetical protein RBB50_008115 [Rhinocladiella similis]